MRKRQRRLGLWAERNWFRILKSMISVSLRSRIIANNFQILITFIKSKLELLL